ncbi:hypothetical protein NR798_02950 [Archangium gephyra]|uniref:hypothetical protein n=1 Tax=Archangium gephyra TaxID=48 RepID=UPI0035D49A3B
MLTKPAKGLQGPAFRPGPEMEFECIREPCGAGIEHTDSGMAEVQDAQLVGDP